MTLHDEESKGKGNGTGHENWHVAGLSGLKVQFGQML